MADYQAGPILIAVLLLIVLYWIQRRSDPEDQDPSLAEMEDELRAMEIEQDIEKGTITEVAPERRENKAGFSKLEEKGLQLRVEIPSPREPTTEFWLPMPDELNGRSKLERFKQIYDVPLDDLDELVGLEVPVEKNQNDEWEVRWREEWRKEFGFWAQVRSALESESNEKQSVNLDIEEQ